MKRFLIYVLLVVASTGALHAQKNSIVGKWKMVSIEAEGMTIDLENPESMKKALVDQAVKQGGAAPDTATINMMYNMLTNMFAGMRLEFLDNGKGVFSMPDETGEIKNDTASFTVDYEKGILNTVSTEEGEEKKEQMTIRFENDYLVMVKPEKNETVKLKRVKD